VCELGYICRHLNGAVHRCFSGGREAAVDCISKGLKRSHRGLNARVSVGEYREGLRIGPYDLCPSLILLIPTKKKKKKKKKTGEP